MRPLRKTFVVLVCLLAIAIPACGPITPASLMMKAGTWAAKELVKKEIKNEYENQKQKKDQKQQEEKARQVRERQAATQRAD